MKEAVCVCNVRKKNRVLFCKFLNIPKHDPVLFCTLFNNIPKFLVQNSETPALKDRSCISSAQTHLIFLINLFMFFFFLQ